MANTWLNLVWATTGLTSAEKLVLLRLADRADKLTNSCFPGIKSIAADTGLQRRAVQLALRKLESAGHIKTTNRTGGRLDNGRPKTTTYTMTMQPIEPEPKGATECAPSGAPACALNGASGASKGAIDDTSTAHLTTGKGAIDDALGRTPVRPNPQEPAAEPKGEPKTEPKGDSAPAPAVFKFPKPGRNGVDESSSSAAVSVEEKEPELTTYSKIEHHAAQQVVEDFGGDIALQTEVSARCHRAGSSDRVYAVLNEAWDRLNGERPRNPGGFAREALKRARIL